MTDSSIVVQTEASNKKSFIIALGSFSALLLIILVGVVVLFYWHFTYTTWERKPVSHYNKNYGDYVSQKINNNYRYNIWTSLWRQQVSSHIFTIILCNIYAHLDIYWVD